MECICCGKEYDEEKAAEEFNEYFNGEHDYDYNGWEGYCADCAISNQEYLDETPRDDYVPPGCRECGNSDIYPECRDSCSRFDD